MFQCSIIIFYVLVIFIHYGIWGGGNKGYNFLFMFQCSIIIVHILSCILFIVLFGEEEKGIFSYPTTSLCSAVRVVDVSDDVPRWMRFLENFRGRPGGGGYGGIPAIGVWEVGRIRRAICLSSFLEVDSPLRTHRVYCGIECIFAQPEGWVPFWYSPSWPYGNRPPLFSFLMTLFSAPLCHCDLNVKRVHNIKDIIE